jgi:hypothetical protein
MVAGEVSPIMEKLDSGTLGTLSLKICAPELMGTFIFLKNSTSFRDLVLVKRTYFLEPTSWGENLQFPTKFIFFAQFLHNSCFF